LPGFFFVVFLVLVAVFVVFVRALVFVLNDVVIVVIIIVVIAESEGSHEQLCTSCDYETGSEAGLAFSRLGGG